MRALLMTLMGGLVAFGIAIGEAITGGSANSVLLEDSTNKLGESGLLFNDTDGVLFVNYPGTGSSCGFFIMPQGSVKANTTTGPWYGGMIFGGVGGPGLGLFGSSGEPEFYIKSTSIIHDSLPESAFVFGRGGVIGTCRVTVVGLTDDSTTYAAAFYNNGRTLPILLLRADGQFAVNGTNTPGGTTGAQTINKASGKVNFAAGASSLVVTNALCSTASKIIATVGTHDATMTSVQAVPGSGSFTLYPNAVPTAETSVTFWIFD